MDSYACRVVVLWKVLWLSQVLFLCLWSRSSMSCTIFKNHWSLVSCFSFFVCYCYKCVISLSISLFLPPSLSSYLSISLPVCLSFSLSLCFCPSFHSCVSHTDCLFGWHDGKVWDLGHGRTGALSQSGPNVLQRRASGHRSLRHHQHSKERTQTNTHLEMQRNESLVCNLCQWPNGAGFLHVWHVWTLTLRWPSCALKIITDMYTHYQKKIYPHVFRSAFPSCQVFDRFKCS